MKKIDTRRRRLPERLGTVLAACLLWAACFDLDQPVEERLLFAFQPEGGLHVKLSVELRHHTGESKATALTRRLRQLEEELLAGLDPWPRRFGEPESELESFFWEKEEGRLVYLERNLLLEDPARLADLLADTAIQPTFPVEDDTAELALFPGLPQRATRRERREMQQILDSWSEQLARYFAAAEHLYRHLYAQPDRAVPCFGAIFEDEGDHGELTAEEELLVEAFSDASGEVLEVLDVDEDRGYSLDELSRRVYDPFPALIEVEIPALAVEVEGFARHQGRFVVPGLSLWSSLVILEGRWLAPDPLLAWVEHERASPDVPFDVVGFAAKERAASTPDAREVRNALEGALEPADVYRVSWPMTGGD